jgi:aminoglycoside phosphotransferase (APT) family kinase protein
MPSERTAGTAEPPSVPAERALAAWFAEVVPGVGNVAMLGSAIARAAGSSAETSFVDMRWTEDGRPMEDSFVLRRQIIGHDLLPEPELSFQAAIMDAVSQRDDPRVRVPRVIGLEPTGAVIGAPFLMMERLPGRIVPQSPNYNVDGWVHALDPDARGRVWANGLRSLAAVHALEWTGRLELVARGRPPGLRSYVGWVRDLVHWAVDGRDHPVAAAAIDYLEHNLPPDTPTRLIWGDATPANMLFDEQGDVAGIIDWEMAALAPGEVDLAWWLMFDELFSAGFGVPRLEGLPDRSETIAIYCEAAGRDVGDMRYYDVLVHLRMAMVALRIADRNVAMGQLAADNDAWLRNPFTATLSQLLDLDPIEAGADFYTVAGDRRSAGR